MLDRSRQARVEPKESCPPLMTLPSIPAWCAPVLPWRGIIGLDAMQRGQQALRRSIVANQAIDPKWTEIATGSPASPIAEIDTEILIFASLTMVDQEGAPFRSRADLPPSGLDRVDHLHTHLCFDRAGL